MRKHRPSEKMDISILALDDDPIMTSTLQAYFVRAGYQVDVSNDPWQAVEMVRQGHYDILLLDFLMTPICGDQVVAELRKFNREIFIVLLTGHKSMAPPIRTIRQLDIQGYYEKDDKFDQLELLVESCVKSIRQMRVIRSYQKGLSTILDALPQVYQLEPEQQAEWTLDALLQLFPGSQAYFVQEAMGRIQQIYTMGEGDLLSLRTALAQKADLKELYPNRHLLCSPLYEKSQLPSGNLGVLLEQPPQVEDTQLFEVLSRQVATAIHNSTLHWLLSQAYQKLGDGYADIIRSLRLVVDAKDTYTRGHSDRVAYLSHRLSQAMGQDEDFCERVRMAGLFHDIGKLAVPDRILLKAGPLTPEEYAVIQKHPEDSARILSAVSLFRDLVPAVRAHHERMDGRGYPDGKKGKEIPLEARIIAVADAFDAMLSDRQYRKGRPLEQVIQEVEKEKGKQFDPQVADALLQLIREEGPEKVLAFMRKTSIIQENRGERYEEVSH